MRTMEKTDSFEKNYMKKLIYFITAVLAALMVIVTETANTQAATSLNVLMDKYVGTTWNGNYHGIQCKGFANYMWYMVHMIKRNITSLTYWEDMKLENWISSI